MFLAALFLTVPALVRAAPEGPFSALTFDAALAEAKRADKVVMIDFFTTWCGPCKLLDRTTWKDPKVVDWLATRCVALKIDAEREVALAKRFEIRAYPTIVFIRPDGTLIDQLVGYRDSSKFLDEAASSLRGRTVLDRSKASLAGNERSPMARQRYASELARAHKYDEALKEYLWCFDEGQVVQPSYSGVRRTFLLKELSQLGRDHPPTLQALRERRDAAEARVAAGSELFDDAADACVLSGTLGDADRLIALYDRVRKGQPLTGRMRNVFGRPLLEPLVQARRYADALALFDSPEGYVKDQLKLYPLPPKRASSGDDKQVEPREPAEPSFRAEVVASASVMYEAVVGAGSDDAAARMADQLIAFEEVGSTYSVLIDRAVRAGKLETARALAERGLASLPDGDKSAVNAARQRIPNAK